MVLTYFQLLNKIKEYVLKVHTFLKRRLQLIMLSIILTIPIFYKHKIVLDSIYNIFFIFFILTISIEDIKTKKISNKLLEKFVVIIIIFQLIYINIDIVDKIKGGLIGGGIFLVIALITNSVGGGDIKYIIILGILLGFKSIIFIIYMSFIISLPICIILLLIKKCSIKNTVAFGPCISLATYLYLYLIFY